MQHLESLVSSGRYLSLELKSKSCEHNGRLEWTDTAIPSWAKLPFECVVKARMLVNIDAYPCCEMIPNLAFRSSITWLFQSYNRSLRIFT